MMPVSCQRVAEGLRRVHRVLARHGIDHEQPLVRSDGRIDVAHLLHQLGIDVQATGGVDDEHVVDAAARGIQRGGCNPAGAAPGCYRMEIRPHLLGQALQLQHGGRPADVGADQQHALLLADEMSRQLARGGGLAGALQAGQQDDGRRCMAQVEGLRAAAHDRHEFIVDHADQRLAGREAALRPRCPAPWPSPRR